MTAPARRNLDPQTVALVFACFFASGAIALMYEVVWFRMIGLMLGEAAYAVTAVVATFMGGLALGSLGVSRLASRVRDPLRIYGWVEVGVALAAGATPVGLWLVTTASAVLQRGLGLSQPSAGVIELMLVSMLLLPPTALMGATLPLLSQAVAGNSELLGRPVGALYAVNTGGAVVGAVIAGYGLLPALGNRMTLASAVAANLALGLVVLRYSFLRGAETRTDQAPITRRHPKPSTRRLPVGAGLTVIALGVSGAVTMTYEVAWTRALALVIGSSTYAFTAMLVAFLVGIAGGSALYAWLLGPKPGSPTIFGALQAAVGLTGVAALALYERMPALFLTALESSQSISFVLALQVAISIVSLLPVTLLAGAVFPCAVAIAARGARPAEDVGRLYAVNTAGAVLGAAFGGLVMLPTLGVHGSLKAGIVTNVVLAVAVVGAARRSALRWRWGVAAAAGLSAAGVALAPAWDVRVLSSGPTIYANTYRALAVNRSFDDVLRGQKEVVFYRDGVTSSVSVGRDGQTTYLRINGKTDASTDVDMATQIALGHLPLLFHADPRRVLVIGLGAGITPGAVAAHPVEQVDVVEIEPAVVEAARFFADVQGNVMRDGRLRLVIGDARSFVRTTPARYDVIISEPSNPWIAGVSALFTVEFFRLARERLAPGGVMLQWIHAYNLFPEDFRMVVKTFQTVFPSTTMWEPDVGDFLLLGRTEAGPLDLDHLRTRFAANATVRRDLQRLGIEAWPGVFALLSLGEAETARFAQSAALNTDDRLRLEFAAPRALYADTRGNLALIRSFRHAGPPFLAGVAGLDQPEAQYWIGMTYLNRGSFSDAIARFQRALERDPSYTPAMRAIALARTTAADRASRQAGPARR